MSNYNVKQEDKLIAKINELYINFRQHFTLLTKEGKYLSSKKMKGTPKLTDPWIRNHLREKQTVVIFSGKHTSKFLCFDVDVKNKTLAKWVTYKVIDGLVNLGFSKSNIHVATSGNKGYHCFLFVKNGTNIENLKMIYEIILKEEELLQFEGGQVEFRLTNTQGVKIELSRNFKNTETDNICWFVDTYTLEPIKNKEHILTINPIPKEDFLYILDEIKDIHKLNKLKVNQEMQLIEKLTEPSSHKLHKHEGNTIERAIELLNNGLTLLGTRHNSILLLAKYFRYMGLDMNECINFLSDWMNKQNKKYYSSTLEESLSEIKRVSKIVYDKEYTLTTEYESIKIYTSEMEKISEVVNKKDKSVLYSMLLHSKRYSLQNGVFYMTQKQICEMVGYKKEDSARAVINKLEQSGYIQVVERNVSQKSTYKKKPNKYKISFCKASSNEEFYELNYDKSTSIADLYTDSMVKLVDINILKNNLPKNQYLELRTYKSNLAI